MHGDKVCRDGTGKPFGRILSRKRTDKTFARQACKQLRRSETGLFLYQFRNRRAVLNERYILTHIFCKTDSRIGDDFIGAYSLRHGILYPMCKVQSNLGDYISITGIVLHDKGGTPFMH